jgi:hypothetical protein
MAKFPVAQNPLLLRFHRLMDSFAKSDDERDFYLDKVEGFLVYVDLDKGQKELDDLEKELKVNGDRYCLIPKMTYYELKKFMEGFVHEKVYDIDTKEKLLDLIQAKEARENFLEFIYDHLNELEKWQQYYIERSRIRIIEWLRSQHVQFVFEEDVEIHKNMMEKLKRYLFDARVAKDVAQVREMLVAKAKTYYSNEALNPRPKRGRPPKQVAKVEVEPQVVVDMYTTVPAPCRLFLYLPDIASVSNVTFSAKFDTEAQLLANLRGSTRVKIDTRLQALSERLESLRTLSSRLTGIEDISLGQEKKMIQEVGKKTSFMDNEVSSKPGITEVARGFLPGSKKRERVAAKPGPVTERKTKMVTQLSSKKPKK